jgi:hypothetical protein
MLRFGRRALPAEVADVALEPGERRQAWALLAGGGAAVATDLGLRLPGRERIDWSDVERVSWQRPVMVVHVLSGSPVSVEGAGERVPLELPEAGELPDAIRSAVTASIGWSSHFRLRPAGGVRLVGRRLRGRELLDWQVVFDRDTDPDGEGVADQVALLLQDARRTIG